ncbi:hypothetical protein [Shinella sp.]|uniref:hypothetical protein n=1 Tax=Shinella sp. TaxID=1870904 RepID=UPI003F6FF5E6
MIKPFDRHDPLKTLRDKFAGKADLQAVAAEIVVLKAARDAARGMLNRRRAKEKLSRLRHVWAWELKLGKAQR